MRITMKYTVQILQQADAGVEYSERYGARCPVCGQKMPITRSQPWEGNTRVRYHKCRNGQCMLGILARPVKSIQSERQPAIAHDLAVSKTVENSKTGIFHI